MAQLYKNDVPILTAGSKSISVADNSEYEAIYDGGNGNTYDAGAVYYIASSGQIKKGNVDYGSRTVELTKAQYHTLVSEGEIAINGITYTYDENELYLVTDEEFDGSYQMTKAQYDTLVANGSIVINGKTIVYDNDTAYFITDYPPTQPCYKYRDFTSVQIARDTPYSTIIIHNETNHGILAPLANTSGGGGMVPLYIPAHKHIKVVAPLSDCVCPDGTLLYSRDGGEIYIYNYRDYLDDAHDIGINCMTVTDKWTGTTKIKVHIANLLPGGSNVYGGSQVYAMPAIWSTGIGPSGYITAYYTSGADRANLKMYVTNNDVIQSTRINITSASISGLVSSGAQLNLNSGFGPNAGIYIDSSDCNEATNLSSVVFELSPQTQSGGGPQTQYKILTFRQEQVTAD